MTDKYRSLAPDIGRCVEVGDVSIRVIEVACGHTGRKECGANSKRIVSVRGEQVLCPKDPMRRCGGCILVTISNAEKHPEWFDAANGISERS